MKRASLLVTLSLWLHAFPPLASAQDNQQQVQFRGTLNVPPLCSVNNGQVIDIDFGERVGVNKVDGKNYLKTVNYEIRCEPGGRGLDMGMRINADAAAYDGSVIQTSHAELGIRLLLNGQPVALNRRMVIDAANPPLLQAVPIGRPGAELTEGVFHAAATLLVDYQ
ncbi:fimbrial protein [Serratia nevei]|uniref:fimbrial protein n=1 Tax=Serratia nevei TaxID=2703794 RepID=UPI00313D8951